MAERTWKLIISGLADNAAVDTVREDSVRKGLFVCGDGNERLGVLR